MIITTTICGDVLSVLVLSFVSLTFSLCALTFGLVRRSPDWRPRG